MARYRVLIVDDQADIRQVLKIGLTTLEIKVEVVDVPSAEEAMLVAASSTFDLMVSDVNLPGISGLDLIRRVKRLHPNMRLMLVTGMTDPYILRQVDEVGAEAFFAKPIDMAAFLDAVRGSLSSVVDLEPVDAAQAAGPAREAKPLPVVDRLENLRRRAIMGLAAVLDVDGGVVAQAGFLNGVYEQDGVAAGLADLYGSGLTLAQQLARLDPENLFYVAGRDYYFYIVSINTRHMLVLTAEQAFRDKLEGFNDWLPDEIRALDLLLHGGPLPVNPEEVEIIPVPEPEPEPEEEDSFELPSLEEELADVQVSAEDRAAIDALFAGAANRRLDGVDLDAFWEDAAEESDSLHIGDGSIPYDEAKDLGLAPD